MNIDERLALLFAKSNISKPIIASFALLSVFADSITNASKTREFPRGTRVALSASARALSSKPVRHRFGDVFTHVFVVVVDRSSDIVRGVRR